MKVNRELVLRAGLQLLDEVGLEQLTLRALAATLKIQAPTLYWHFQSKEELIDAMATRILAEGAADLLPSRLTDHWQIWGSLFGHGLRKTLLKYRDGARMVAGSQLTDTVYMETAERIGARLIEAGFSLRTATIVLSTIYAFTVSFVIEEQAVFPRKGKRAPAYELKQRRARLNAKKLPLLRESGEILFDGFDRRYRESLELIIRGAAGMVDPPPGGRKPERSESIV